MYGFHYLANPTLENQNALLYFHLSDERTERIEGKVLEVRQNSITLERSHVVRYQNQNSSQWDYVNLLKIVDNINLSNKERNLYRVQINKGEFCIGCIDDGEY